MRITEAKAREIWQAKDLSKYSHAQCAEADKWIEAFALRTLRKRLKGLPPKVAEYVLLMTRRHMGSVEADNFLTALDCYPKWMTPKGT